ncbi:hypothetical protein C5S42_00070 [Candidatus Methanomarinus sp.]|nr:hypothetical protein C5S42_00070 [ANME-2 cluster archaeon]
MIDTDLPAFASKMDMDNKIVEPSVAMIRIRKSQEYVASKSKKAVWKKIKGQDPHLIKNI